MAADTTKKHFIRIRGANVNNLKEQYNKASMKSDKMEIDDKIYDEEQKQKQLIKKLKGDITNG